MLKHPCEGNVTLSFAEVPIRGDFIAFTDHLSPNGGSLNSDNQLLISEYAKYGSIIYSPKRESS